MEWGDPKPPPQWDWDGLAAFDPKNMIQSQPPLEFWGLESGPLYSPDDLGQGYSSKSSISASTESVKELVRTEETKESEKVEESSGGSSEAVVSVCSGSVDPPIGLKLGKRTYFEDLSVGSEAKTSGVSTVPSRSASMLTKKKKARASQQGSQVTRCQVEGCNLDLTGAKGYHKKHKVCESHSKSPRVVVLGREKRFCQQCSRFHDLSEFDQKKRSCRRRLYDHNARRRKPPPEMISFTSARSSSLLYDDPHQINFLWNRSPFSYPGSNAASTWGSSSEFRGPPAGDFSIRSEKLGVASGSQRCLPINELPLPFPVIQHDIDRLLPSKGTAIEIVSKGMDATTVASQMNGAPDIRRALSLLSNETWGLDSPEPRSVLNQVHTNNTGVHYSEIQSHPEDWVADLPLLHNSRKPPFTLYTGASRYQEFQLLRPVHGTASFDQNHIHLSSE